MILHHFAPFDWKFLQIGKQRAKDLRKNGLILQKEASTNFLHRLPFIRVILLQKRSTSDRMLGGAEVGQPTCKTWRLALISIMNNYNFSNFDYFLFNGKKVSQSKKNFPEVLLYWKLLIICIKNAKEIGEQSHPTINLDHT